MLRTSTTGIVKGEQLCEGEETKSGGEKREKKDSKPYFIVFYKVHKSCPLYFHRLPLSVVESQNKVEEIGFPQVGGWLLFKVSSGQSYSAVEETHGIGCGGRDKDITNPCSSSTSKTTGGHGRRDSGEARSGRPGAGAAPGPPLSPATAGSELGASPGGGAQICSRSFLRGPGRRSCTPRAKKPAGLGALNPRSWC